MTPETLKSDRITVDPAVMNGTPVIKGTTLPVFLIVSEIFSADSLDEVLNAYSITEADAQAALEHTGIEVDDINDPTTWRPAERTEDPA